MAEHSHSKECETAEVGSECDCPCAGRKHAVKKTAGNVPGAGSVTKRAQKLAAADGRAAVVNNRAPKASDDDGPNPGNALEQRAAAATVAKFGAKATVVDHNNTREGDRVTHVRQGPGTVERMARSHENTMRVKFDDGTTAPVLMHETVKGKPPVTLMSDLSKYDDAELKAQHAAIEAKIRPQGGISGPQADIQQRIERELARRDTTAGGDGPNPGNALEQRAAAATVAKFPGATVVDHSNTREGDKVTHVRKGTGTVARMARSHENTMSVKFDDGTTAPVLMHETVKGGAAGGGTAPNTGDGSRGAAVEGGGAAARATVAADVRRFADETFKVNEALRQELSNVARDIGNGLHSRNAAARSIEMMALRRKDLGLRDRMNTLAREVRDGKTGAASNPGNDSGGSSAGGGDGDRKERERADWRKARLSNSVGRRARVDELSGLSREQFDALPSGQRAEALEDLKNITTSGDKRSTRDSMGIAGKADQRHVGRAADLLRRFTAQVRPPAPPKPPVVQRFDETVTRYGTIDPFLKGLDRAELTALGEAKGWIKPGEDKSYKLFYLRQVLAKEAFEEIRARENATPKTDPDKMQVASTKRNGDVKADQVDGPGGQAKAVADLPDNELRADRAEAERRSLDQNLSFAQRNAARTRMFEAEKELFRRENPHRTPGPGADTFQGKKVPLVTENQQPVLEIVAKAAHGQADLAKGLPQVAVNGLVRAGVLKTTNNPIDGRLYLTEKGHQKLAAQRGDGIHQQLNEKVAAAAKALEQVTRSMELISNPPGESADARRRRLSDRLFAVRRSQKQDEVNAANNAYYRAKQERDDRAARKP